MPDASGYMFELPGQYLRPAMMLCVLSVWMLAGLFLYLNSYTRRRYFTLWSAAWLFYAIWLTLSLNVPDSSGFLLMAEQLCVGIAATFMIWGASTFLNQVTSQRVVALFFGLLVIWSYLSTYYNEEKIWFQLPIFSLMGLASIATGCVFYRCRRQQKYRGASLLCFGFLLWGVYLTSYPLWRRSDQMITSGFIVSAVLQLFIAVSMMVLVLEEVRSGQQQAWLRFHEKEAEADGLRTRVVCTEERYRSLFSQASEAIVIAAADDLRILDFNHAAHRLLGIGSEEAGAHLLSSFLRLPIDERLPQTGSEWYSALLQHHRVELVRADGTLVRVEVGGAPVSFEQSTAYQFFFREATERARLEQQLRQSEKLSALGQMISGVAHELNNPLAVIKGYLDLVLARHDLGPQTKADLEKVARESNRAAKLVGNFLCFARERPPCRQRVELNRLVKGVLELREMDFRIVGIQSVLELEPNLPTTEADPNQLEQVLVNLISNALQALADWPGRRCLKVATSYSGERIVVKVEDSGPGIPADILPHVFEPFFTTKEVGCGTGLGLSIAHSIITEHQGRISYEPSGQGGAGFAIELPIIEPNEEEPKPHVDSLTLDVDEQTAVSLVSEVRILVLDDEQVLAELLGEILMSLGHRPVVCCAAVRALELIEQQAFDIIISDFRMPLMNGREFYERVHERRPDLAKRIIFLTGDVVSAETAAFLNAIGNAHLSKPFQLDTIAKAIADVLLEEPVPA
jgi:PAS domain S-box-containing protein